MLQSNFHLAGIKNVVFGVGLKDGSLYSVAADGSVQEALTDVLLSLAGRVEAPAIGWEAFSVSEEYGGQKLLYNSLNDGLMERYANLYKAGAFKAIANVRQIVDRIEFYFASFFDDKGAKLICLKKATRFKGVVGEKSRLVRLVDDTLQLIDGDVFRVENDFDLALDAENVLIFNVRAFELIGGLQAAVAAAAETRLTEIESGISFIDLSGIKENIAKHPRSARLAVSISKRVDLHKIKMENLRQLAEAQSIKLLEGDDGKVRPRVADQHKFLELLDDRRYISRLTGENVAFIARSRVRAAV